MPVLALMVSVVSLVFCPKRWAVCSYIGIPLLTLGSLICNIIVMAKIVG